MARTLEQRIREIEAGKEAAGEAMRTTQAIQDRPGCDLSGFPGRTLGEKIGAVARVVRGEATASPEAMNAGRCWVATVQRLIDEY